MLNYNLLDKSDFITAAFPAQYGNAVGGVFDLQIRAGNNQKREYLGQIGFNGFELGAEGPVSNNSKASYLANYRYSTLGAFQAVGLEFGTGSAIPQYQDANFKVVLPTEKAGTFSVFGLGGLSRINLLTSSPSRPYAKQPRQIDIHLYQELNSLIVNPALQFYKKQGQMPLFRD